jgi:putative ABC transport system permease protein
VDGVEVAALVAARAAAQAGGADERTRAAWVLTREQRITYAASFPPDNRILEGAPFRADLPGELSVEASFARDLGLVLGSVLRFDVQGVEVVLTVTSIRSVEWRSLGANFFLVAEPGPLDAAPQFRIGALRLPEAAEQGLQDALGASHPHISMLRVRGLLTRLRDALDGAALGVRVLAGFAALAALSVLVASVAASPVRQRREAALLKVLGLTARELRLWYGVEYALIGLVGGGVGAGFAYLLAWAFARAALKLEQAPGPAPAFVGALVAAAATLTVGLIGSARARRAPAADTLRE